MNKKITNFQGSELLSFIVNIPKVICFLQEHFPKDNNHVLDIIEGFQLWFRITPFLVITKIDDDINYKGKLDVGLFTVIA